MDKKSCKMLNKPQHGEV